MPVAGHTPTTHRGVAGYGSSRCWAVGKMAPCAAVVTAYRCPSRSGLYLAHPYSGPLFERHGIGPPRRSVIAGVRRL